MFVEDFRLICTNSMAFNEIGSWYFAISEPQICVDTVTLFDIWPNSRVANDL